MQTISIPKTSYKKLLQKARMFEQFLFFSRNVFPLKNYSDTQIDVFEKTDKIPDKLRKSILKTLKNKK